MNSISVVILGLLFVLDVGCGSDVLYVQHAPSYYQISKAGKDEAPLKTSQFSDVVLASVGFTTYKDFHWDGIKSSTFFQRPEAVVVAEFDGFENVKALADGGFPLTVDVEPSSAYLQIYSGINARYPLKDLLTMDITNDDNFYTLVGEYPEILEGIETDPDRVEESLQSKKSQLKSLNISNFADKDFLAEMQLLDEVSEALATKFDIVGRYKAVDLIWMQSIGLRNLKSVYGVASPQVDEATSIIRAFLKRLETRLTKLYDGNYLMFVLTVDFQSEGPRSRMGRSLLADLGAALTNGSSLNLSPSYDEDYPAMFNILLFVSLLLSLTVFAIALGMWHIDPGRDSIIYRMTSQRMKKDQ